MWEGCGNLEVTYEFVPFLTQTCCIIRGVVVPTARLNLPSLAPQAHNPSPLVHEEKMQSAPSNAASARAKSKSSGPRPGKQSDPSMLPPMPGNEALKTEQVRHMSRYVQPRTSRGACHLAALSTHAIVHLGPRHFAVAALSSCFLPTAPHCMHQLARPCVSLHSPGSALRDSCLGLTPLAG